MCIPACTEWIEAHLTRAEVQGRRVLEVGSYDVNGSVRPIFARLGAAAYVGSDMRPGPGVDVVCAAENLVARFGAESFDIVISTCVLEHVRHWKEAVSSMKQVCKPGGLLLVVVPSQWPFHAYPGDFWRYERSDMQAIFADSTLLQLDEDPQPPALVYMKAQKPANFHETSLANYRLRSIITGTRVLNIRRRDFLTPSFAAVLAGYLVKHLDPKLAKPLVYVAMGIKLKLIDPLRRTVRQAKP